MAQGKRALSWVGSLTLLGLAVPAYADEAADKEQAIKLIDQGNAHYAAHEYPEAIADYRQAYDFYPSPKILLNLAQAEHASGRPDRAAAHYEEFLASTSVGKNDPLLGSARERVEALSRELGRVIFEAAEPGTLFSLDQSPPAPLPTPYLWIVPGRHELRLEREGAEPFTLEIEIGAGRKLPVRAALKPLLPDVPAPPPPALVSTPVAPPPPESPSITGRWWFWAGLGVLVAGGVAVAVAANTGGNDFVPGGELGRFPTSDWERLPGGR